MISVTRLNHSSMILNSDTIECIENTPDTVITLINARKIVVLETTDQIVESVRAWRRSLVSSDLPKLSAGVFRASPSRE